MGDKAIVWESKPLPPFIGAGIVICIGLAVAIGGWVWRANYSSFLANAAHTNGTVIAIVHRSRHGRGSYPVFAFRDAEGRKYAVRSEYSSIHFEKGDAVDVAYDPSSPSDAVLIEGTSAPILPTMMIGIGLFLAIAGFPMGWRQYQYEKRHRRDAAAS